MKTATYKIGERKIEVQKINLLYRASVGRLPAEITKYVNGAMNGEKEETEIDQFKLLGDIYQFLDEIIIEPKNSEELFDELSQKELMELFVAILYDLPDVKKNKELEKEIEQAKNS